MTYEMNRLATEVAEHIERHVHGSAWHERDLSDAIEHVLAAIPGLVCAREFVLGAHGRLDFIVTTAARSAAGPFVALEVKINGSIAALTRQIDRYLSHEQVGGVVVVTTRMALMRLPSSLRMKPIRGCLIRGGL